MHRLDMSCSAMSMTGASAHSSQVCWGMSSKMCWSRASASWTRTSFMPSVARRLISSAVVMCHCSETFVHEAAQSLPSKQKVHRRNSAVVAYVSGSPEEEPDVVLVRRTFWEVPGTCLRAPSSVTQSTTEAVERGAKNPRRRVWCEPAGALQ